MGQAGEDRLDTDARLRKSYLDIEAELIAGGVAVPPGIRMLASAERDESNNPRIAAVKWHPILNS